MRNWKFWLGVSILAAVSLYAAKYMTFRAKAYAHITATPFVAEIAIYNFENNPQGDLIIDKVIARRSDGSTVEVSRQAPVWGASRRSVTLMSGATFHAFDLVSSKTNFKLKPQELARLKEKLTNPPPDCNVHGPRGKVIGREALFGQELTVVQHDANSERTTHWMAPKLGCEALRYRIEEMTSSGSYKLVAEGRLVSLEVKEPDSALFDPADSYETVLPSEILRRVSEKVGVPESAQEKSSAQRADKSVREHQQ